jgi:hypothetical protein
MKSDLLTVVFLVLVFLAAMFGPEFITGRATGASGIHYGDLSVAATGWARCKSRRALPPGRHTRDSGTRSSKRGRRCKGTSRRSRRRPRTLRASVCTPRETLGLVCTAYRLGSAKERSRRCTRGMERRARALRRPAPRSRRPSRHPWRRLSRRTRADRSTGRSRMPAKANSHSRPSRSSRGAPQRGNLRSRRPSAHPPPPHSQATPSLGR